MLTLKVLATSVWQVPQVCATENFEIGDLGSLADKISCVP